MQRGLGGFHQTKRCKPHERYAERYPCILKLGSQILIV
jgi:hypothetical protein